MLTGSSEKMQSFLVLPAQHSTGSFILPYEQYYYIFACVFDCGINSTTTMNNVGLLFFYTTLQCHLLKFLIFMKNNCGYLYIIGRPSPTTPFFFYQSLLSR